MRKQNLIKFNKKSYGHIYLSLKLFCEWYGRLLRWSLHHLQINESNCETEGRTNFKKPKSKMR